MTEPTVAQSIVYLRTFAGGEEPYPDFIWPDHVDQVVDFAAEMIQMINGLGRVSFPIPKYLRITLDPDDESDAVFINSETADRVYRALGEALKGQTV